MGKGGSGLSWSQSVFAQRREWSCVVDREEEQRQRRISPLGSAPLLPLLNSFNKHLTFTGKKSIPSRGDFCVHELLQHVCVNVTVTKRLSQHCSTDLLQHYSAFCVIKTENCTVYCTVMFVHSEKRADCSWRWHNTPSGSHIGRCLGQQQLKTADCIVQLAVINPSCMMNHCRESMSVFFVLFYKWEAWGHNGVITWYLYRIVKWEALPFFHIFPFKMGVFSAIFLMLLSMGTQSP